MKMTVLYHSPTGHTAQMAEEIVHGMQSVSGVEARAFTLAELDAEYLAESCGVVFGTPTYLANMSGSLKQWLDGPGLRSNLAGKLGGAFATADYLHGGAEIALQGILNHLLVLGMLVYSGGGAYGKPVIHLGPVALSDALADSAENFRLYGKRMATKALEIFG